MNKINLTPIIDVVFILLIFFMLATNFQDFSQTDIELSNESSKSMSSDKKMYVVSVDKDKSFMLNDKSLHLNDIKAKILTSVRSEEEHLVVIKPNDDVNMQLILSVMVSFSCPNTTIVSLKFFVTSSTTVCKIVLPLYSASCFGNPILDESPAAKIIAEFI